MTASNTSKYIEDQLDISLPDNFKKIYDSFPLESYVGKSEQEFWHNAEQIVKYTKMMRNGYVGLKEWPNNLIYLGDDGAACPYALNVDTGIVMHLDHGDITAGHLGSDISFDEWISWFIDEYPLREAESSGSGCLSLMLAGPLFYLLLRLV